MEDVGAMSTTRSVILNAKTATEFQDWFIFLRESGFELEISYSLKTGTEELKLLFGVIKDQRSCVIN